MNQENYESCSVELVQGCVNGDLLVVNAARASFAKEKIKLTPDDTGLLRYLATGFRTKEWTEYLNQVKQAVRTGDDELLERLLKAYRAKAVHWAPFGHPHVTLRLVMPVFLARQFVKHQVGGVWSEASRRYLDDKWTFYKEPEWHSRPDDIKQGSGAALSEAKQTSINNLVDTHIEASLKLYNYMRTTGVAPEEAREIMPLNHMTTVVWTGSLLFWVRVVQLRVEAHAQLAAQELGKQIAKEIQSQCPLSWNALMR
jgi:thymidylate synthase (FAD)